MPFEIPDSWEWTRLEDVCTKFSTGPFGSMLHKSDYMATGVPVVNPANIVKGAIHTEKIMYISSEKAQELSKYILSSNDILLARRGDLSKCAIATNDNVGWLCGTGSFVMHLCIVESVYFQYIYATQYIQDLLSEASVGATMDNLNQDAFSNILIPIPPQNEQQRIINEINLCFDLIDNINNSKRELIEVINNTKSKVLNLAIHGKLVPQDPNDEPAIELLKRINPHFVPCDTSHYENLPFEIPQNWVWVRIKDIAISELGKTLDKGKNSGKLYDYLCALNVKWGAFDLTIVKQILLEDKERERYLVRKGDLLICEGGDVGRAAIWDNDEEIYYQNALHRVRFKGGINQYFYLYTLQYYKHLGLIDDVSGGVTIKHFTQNSMQKLLFPLPPLAEQKRIVKKIGKIFETIDKITAEL